MNDEKYFKKDYAVSFNENEYVKMNYYQENKDNFDSFDYLWKEMWECFDCEADGCTYERFGCKVNEGDVVVDIGANIGMFANRAAYKGASKIICFEPLTPAFRCLIENKPENTEVYKFGISDRREMAKIKTPTKLEYMACSTIDGEITNSCLEENVYLDSLNNLYEIGLLGKVDFLKIDCEGHEHKVLQGLSDSVIKEMGISKLAIEFHNSMVKKELMDHTIKRFEMLGFKFFVLFGGDVNLLNLWK